MGGQREATVGRPGGHLHHLRLRRAVRQVHIHATPASKENDTIVIQAVGVLYRLAAQSFQSVNAYEGPQ